MSERGADYDLKRRLLQAVEAAGDEFRRRKICSVVDEYNRLKRSETD